MTDVLKVDPNSPDRAAIARAADCLRRGGLVAFPTETVYGLGANALDRTAVTRVFEAKRRPTHDPLIVHVGSTADVPKLVAAVPAATSLLADRFWPGPLTLVMRRSTLVSDEVTAGLDTVAVRVPAHPVARALIEATRVPIAAPSANIFSRPSPTTAAHVLQDLAGRIDLVIDGGPTAVGLESTVLDLSGPVPVVLRPGAVTVEMLREVLPGVRMRSSPTDNATATRSPGLTPQHYSPRAPLTLYEGAPRATIDTLMWDARAALVAGSIVGIVAADEDRVPLSALAGFEGLPPQSKPRLLVAHVGSQRNLTAIAARLYAALRELDAAGVDRILVRGFEDESGLGAAIRDRLRRAAAGRIVRC